MKYCFSLLLLLSLSTVTFSQDETAEEPKKGFDEKNIFFGGNLGLQFGNYTFVNVSPQIGYHLNKYLDIGLGPNFQYVSQKSYYSNGDDFAKQSMMVYGANIFGRFYPIKQGFFQVQPEYNWINGKYKFYNAADGTNYSYKASAPSLLLGVGANLNGLLISVMYDVVQDPNSPYSNKPFINFGYAF